MVYNDATLKRFWSKVDKSGGTEACWPWLSGNDGKYGTFWVDGRYQKAHRISFQIANARRISDGLMACHSCDNPICVNPSHVWEGNNADNMIDASHKGRLAHIKLSPSQIAYMKLLIAHGKAQTGELAQLYGVSKSTARRIKSGHIWSAITQAEYRPVSPDGFPALAKGGQ